MADEYTFYESNNPVSETEFQFSSRQTIWIPDSNGGTYQNQIQFDLSNFSNSSKYIDWKSSVLTIPLCLSVQGVGMSTLTENNFAASLKNGYHQLINSLSVSLCNNEVITIQNFQNLLINYKILTSFSETDVTNYGSTLGFGKDNALTSQMLSSVGGSVYGQGVCNNVIGNKAGSRGNLNTIDLAYGYNLKQNTGRLQRMLSTSCNETDIGASGFVTGNTFDGLYKNTVAQNTATNITYHILATIPMSFLHDYFAKCPLMKNGYYKLTINTNTNITITQTINVVAGPPCTATITSTTINTPFGTNPVMLSPIAPLGASTGDGFVIANTAGVQTITTTLRIVGSGQPGVTAHPMTQCRIYGSIVEMTPQYETIYLQNAVKKIIYNDILSFNNILNQAPGTPTNVTLTPGLSRLRRLTIFPFISSGANGLLNNTPMNSPYASEPGTCSPYCVVNQFNVLLSGQVVYNQNKTYAFENYLDECRGVRSINGGMCNGLSTGLLSQMDHDASYGFITVDLSRHNKESDNISKSVQVQFTNCGRYACDYICIIEYEKEINVNTETGQLIL